MAEMEHPARGGARHEVRSAISRARTSRSEFIKTPIDFKAINRAAVAVLPALLARWLPKGRRFGREYVALNPRRSDQRLGSFKIALEGARAGAWADFATGDKGGDVISLAAYLFGLSQSEAARRISQMIGIHHAR